MSVASDKLPADSPLTAPTFRERAFSSAIHSETTGARASAAASWATPARTGETVTGTTAAVEFGSAAAAPAPLDGVILLSGVLKAWTVQFDHVGCHASRSMRPRICRKSVIPGEDDDALTIRPRSWRNHIRRSGRQIFVAQLVNDHLERRAPMYVMMCPSRILYSVSESNIKSPITCDGGVFPSTAGIRRRPPVP